MSNNDERSPEVAAMRDVAIEMGLNPLELIKLLSGEGDPETLKEFRKRLTKRIYENPKAHVNGVKMLINTPVLDLLKLDLREVHNIMKLSTETFERDPDEFSEMPHYVSEFLIGAGHLTAEFTERLFKLAMESFRKHHPHLTEEELRREFGTLFTEVEG